MEAKKKQIDDEWELKKAKYKGPKGKGLAPGEKVHHRTPKSAGGCPTGEKNLVPDSSLSKSCQEVAKDLDDIHNDVMGRWHKC